jgi:hypothetical protein
MAFDLLVARGAVSKAFSSGGITIYGRPKWSQNPKPGEEQLGRYLEKEY